MRFRLMLFLLILPAGAAFSPHVPAAASYAQATSQQPAQVGTIRVSANLVQVPVSVTDTNGQPVKDLQLADFVIEENGKAVPIAQLGEPGVTRLEMALVFDNTGSVFSRFDFEQEAARSFLKTIFRPSDAVAILTILSRPRILLERTSNLTEALDGLGQLQASGSATAFFDTVILAARMLRKQPDPETRRVQIILSDGEDNYSELKLSDALREVQQADSIFYSINPGGQSIRLNTVSLRGQQAMEALATETGGAAFLAEKVDELAGIFGRISAELQAQYLLSYYSPPDPKSDGSFRQISVRVPKRPALRVRARQGYYPRKI